MKYLCYKKEEFKLKDKDQNLMKNIENKEDLKKYENFYQEYELINLDEITITEKSKLFQKRVFQENIN